MGEMSISMNEKKFTCRKQVADAPIYAHCTDDREIKSKVE